MLEAFSPGAKTVSPSPPDCAASTSGAYLDRIDDAIELALRAEEYRAEYNNVRPTKPSPGSSQKRCTWAWPTPPSRHSDPKRSCKNLT